MLNNVGVGDALDIGCCIWKCCRRCVRQQYL